MKHMYLLGNKQLGDSFSMRNTLIRDTFMLEREPGVCNDPVQRMHDIFIIINAYR
jgi:hypothetical protein